MRSPGARLIRSAAAWRNARKSAPDPRQEGPLRRHLYAFLAAGLTAAVQATPTVLNDACYVRSEPPPSTDARPSESRPAQSHLGLRRRATQLVEVELTVAGENLSVCTVSGIARVRGSSGQEILVLRFARARARRRGGTAVCAWCRFEIPQRRLKSRPRRRPAASKASAMGRSRCTGNDSSWPIGSGRDPRVLASNINPRSRADR